MRQALSGKFQANCVIISTMGKLWLVKDKKARISGPYNAEEISHHIEEGKFSGEELVASYPSGRWKPLTAYSFFYDKLLQVLSEQKSPQDTSSEFFDEESEKVMEPTVIIPQQFKKPGSENPSSDKKQKIRIKSSNFEEEIEESEVIEMEEAQKNFLSQLLKAIRWPVIVLCALVAFFLLYKILEEPSSSSTYRIPLSAPKKKIAPFPNEEFIRKKQKAIAFYLKGDISSYLKAQSHFVQLLEGHPDFLAGYQYLCLIYLELWPFSLQDTKDQKLLKSILEKVGTLNRGGVYAKLCNGVADFLKGDYKKVTVTVNNAVKDPDTDQMIHYFYYLKSKALKKLNRENDVLAYIRGITQILPKWVAPYMLNGKIHYKRGEFPAAIRSFQQVLSIVPEHRAAGLLLGITEYKYLKQIDKAEKRLSDFLNRDFTFVDPEILKEAHLTLAKISLQQQDKSKALQQAEKAYTFDPSNEEINVFLTRLGGEKPEKSAVKTRQMIYKGDLFFDQGNCFEAQKFYLEAYKIDKKKNAMAAIRMAKCFWKNGISGQAVQWLKKAITADPKRMESYFLLADYLSTNYSFEEARDILRIAARQAPNSYEVFKGYALIAFRQKSYGSAVHYGKQALDRYSSDIEVHLILSKAYRALGKRNKEFKYAEQAVKADPNSIEAQINFAWGRSSAYGFAKGEEYLSYLISKFPLTIEYRQALGEYYFKNERYNKALALLENLPGHDPDYKPTYIYLGRIYSLFGLKQKNVEKLKRSVKYFLKAAILDPSDPNPLFYMGLSYMHNEQYLEAESQFEKVLGINSKYPLIHYYIGKANFLQGGKENMERALKAAKTEKKTNPNLALAYILTGDIYKTQAKKKNRDSFRRKIYYELCVKEYQKALQLRKNDVDLYVELINCYRGAGELDSALQLADQMIANHGTSGYPEFHRQLGLIHELKGDYEKARVAYESYFALLPGAPDKKKIERRLNGYSINKTK